MWLTLTESHLQTGLAGAELTAYRTKALSAGQADPVPEVLSRVTRMVRGYVAACTQNVNGPAGTIPDELLGAAVSLAAHELAKRLPLPSSLTERLDKAHAEAMQQLRDTAACRFAIEQPPADQASTEAIPGTPSPKFTDKSLTFTRAHQDGL